MIVALAVSAVGSLEHVRADKDRTNRPLRSRHFDEGHGLAVNIDGIDGLVEQDVRADLVRVVHRVPEIGHDLLRVRQPLNLALAVLLADTKDYDAAVRVGERAVRRPEIGGHAAPRPLEFDGGILALRDKSLYLFALHLDFFWKCFSAYFTFLRRLLSDIPVPCDLSSNTTSIMSPTSHLSSWQIRSMTEEAT